ncbi:MAG: signal peptidase II [Planctomycetes bacterium]|nr:signal peptidase II [Planctomycetota bacterium]
MASTESAANDRPGAAVLLNRFAWVALLVAADLWSKSAVFAWLQPLEGQLPRHACGLFGCRTYPLLGDWFSFRLSRNPGAAFGKFGDMPYLLIGGRIAASLFVAWLILRSSPRRPWVSMAFTLILAGALGNLYDNLFLAEAGSGHPFGLVRDFIDVYFGVWDWHFPTFNVADSCISVGATILVLNGLFTRTPAEPTAPAS